VEAVREALPERYRVLADLGSGLGLRQGECFGFSPGDVKDWLRPGGAVARIRLQVRTVHGHLVFAPPKGGKERDVPVPESVKLALAEHLGRFPARLVTLPWLEPGGKPVTAELMLTTPAGQAVNKNRFKRRRLEVSTAEGRRASRAPERLPCPAALLRQRPAARRVRHQGPERVPGPRLGGVHAGDLYPPDAGCG
jgi:integrase